MAKRTDRASHHKDSFCVRQREGQQAVLWERRNEMESCAALAVSQHKVFPSSVTPTVLGPEHRADSTMSILGPCVALAWDTSVTVLVFWQVT